MSDYRRITNSGLTQAQKNILASMCLQDAGLLPRINEMPAELLNDEVLRNIIPTEGTLLPSLSIPLT